MYESVHFHTEQAGGREYLIVEQHNMPTHKFEIVDRVPLGYHVWNIGENMPDGYLPLCRLCASQPFEGATAIDPSTLKAIAQTAARKSCAPRTTSALRSRALPPRWRRPLQSQKIA